MSQPRERHPGSILFITRRTERRAYRLGGPEMGAAFVTAWAAAAKRSGVRLLCLAVMDNHYHAVVWDPDGRLAEHLRDTHALVARFGNVLDGVAARFWDGRQTFVQELLDAQTVVEKMAYVMGNPVRHGIVRSPSAWDGPLTSVGEIGARGRRYARPSAFFAYDGDVPEEAALETFVPPMCESAFGLEGFKRRVGQALGRFVAAARARAKRMGRKFKGMEAIRARSRTSRPATPSQRSAGKRAVPGRRVAGVDAKLRARVLERMSVFRSRYRDALELCRSVVRNVVFPAGTWLLWQLLRVTREVAEPALLAEA